MNCELMVTETRADSLKRTKTSLVQTDRPCDLCSQLIDRCPNPDAQHVAYLEWNQVLCAIGVASVVKRSNETR